MNKQDSNINNCLNIAPFSIIITILMNKQDSNINNCLNSQYCAFLHYYYVFDLCPAGRV